MVDLVALVDLVLWVASLLVFGISFVVYFDALKHVSSLEAYLWAGATLLISIAAQYWLPAYVLWVVTLCLYTVRRRLRVE